MHADHILFDGDGNGAGSDRIFVDFESSGFGFRDDFLPMIFGFWFWFGFAFCFSPVDIQWITVSNKNSYFIVYLITTLFI